MDGTFWAAFPHSQRDVIEFDGLVVVADNDSGFRAALV